MFSKDFVGNVATVVTIGSFFAGAPVCLKFKKKGSTGDFSAIPFIVGSLCNALWLRYGLYIGDSTLAFVNAVGFILQMSYVICFYMYASNKVTLYKQLLLSGIALSVMTIYLLWIADNIEAATHSCGIMAAVGSIAFSASTLATLADVIRTKSTENLPFPVIAASFVVTFLWLIYGILARDIFVQIPNAIGATICGLQLCLFLVYPSKISRTE